MYQLSATLQGHTQDVKDIIALADGKLTSVSRDGNIMVWNLEENGEWQGTVMQKRDIFVNSCCYRAKDGIVFYGSKDGLINGTSLYDKFGGDPVYTLIGHESNVCCLSMGSEGIDVLSGSWDKTAKVWENGVVKWDLRGHSGSVWDVKSISQLPEHYLTASADRTVKMWRGSECVKSFGDIHTDVIRHIEVLNSNEFVSCSNDGTIKISNFQGDVLRTLNGHESFVYSVKVFENGDLVSCGEDRSVRIWSPTGQLKQVIIVPAISVWCVDILPNDDIVIGTSDGVIRIFTQDKRRIASEEQIKNFHKDVQGFSINSQVMGVDESKLSPHELLNAPGKKEGQIIVVKSPSGVVEAHQYSQGKWMKVGDVVSSSGSDQKKEFEGKFYDYVFDVDIEEGQPPLKLPVNANDNAYVIADEFLSRHELPATYRNQVVDFIFQNTTGVSFDPKGSSKSSSVVPQHIEEQKILPVRQYLSMTNYNPDSIFLGITKLNSEEPIFDDENLAQIGTALHDLEQNWEVLYLFAVNMRSKWTVKTPAYDILRLVVPKLSSSDDIREFIEEGLGNKNLAIAMLTVRIFVNCFQNNKWGIDLMSSSRVYNSIFETIEINFEDVKSRQLQNLAIAIATLLFNYSFLIIQDPIKLADSLVPISDALNTKFGTHEIFQASEEAAYRLLVAYGNLSTVEPSLRKAAGSITWIKNIKAYYGNISRFRDILEDMGAE